MSKTKCTVGAAAQILGKSEMAVYQDVARRRIPFRKSGRRIYFFVEELQEYLDRQPGVTVDQALENAPKFGTKASKLGVFQNP